MFSVCAHAHTHTHWYCLCIPSKANNRAHRTVYQDATDRDTEYGDVIEKATVTYCFSAATIPVDIKANEAYGSSIAR